MSISNAKKIWDKLKSLGYNDYAISGIMGNLKAESNLVANNLQNSYNKSLGMTDEEYTEKVDKKEYISFVVDTAGYGLAQWTYWSRKAKLLLFCQSRGKSIGDTETQLLFLDEELRTSYQSLYGQLKKCRDVNTASDLILKQYERPADMGVKAQTVRRKYAQDFYQKFHENSVVHVDTYEIGSIVEIKACRQYTSSVGTLNYSAKSGYAVINHYAPNSKHPYHCIKIKGSNSNVYGWVDVDSIVKTVKSVDDLAREVIAGKWGNGVARKNALIDYGLDYNIIQSRVNEMLKGEK